MKEKKLLAGFYILMVYLEVATSLQHIYPVTYNSKYYIGILLTIVFFCLFIINKSYWLQVEKKMSYLAVLLVIPVAFSYIYSDILIVLFPIEYAGLPRRTFGLLVYGLLAIIQAYFTFCIFRKKAVDYTFVAISLNYLTSIIVALKKDGLKQFVSLISDSHYVGSVLEMHEVAPIISLFVFYFWHQYRIEKGLKNKMIIKEMICCIIILLSMKRIVLLSCAIGLVVYEFLRNMYYRSKVKKIPALDYISGIGILFVIVMLSFVWFVRSGAMYSFLNIFHINSMARAEFWNAIETQYNFSVSYWGHGMGFVSIWMDNNWMNLGIAGLTQSIGIHSDVLKFFIDLGFVGFVFYFGYYLVYLTRKIGKKFGIKSSILYLVIMIIQLLIYFTDNISIYHNYQWIMYLMIYSLVAISQKDVFTRQDII